MTVVIKTGDPAWLTVSNTSLAVVESNTTELQLSPGLPSTWVPFNITVPRGLTVPLSIAALAPQVFFCFLPGDP